MTPKQCQAARRLLGWSRVRLAGFAGIREAVILEFEQGERVLAPARVAAVRAVLEAEGVGFSPEDGGCLGVRLHERVLRPAALDRARDLRHRAAVLRESASRPSARGRAARLVEMAGEMEALAAAIEAQYGVSRPHER